MSDQAREPYGLPAKVSGPWGRESGHPRVWTVVVPGWVLAECPREDVAHHIAQLWNAAPAERAPSTVVSVREEEQ